MDLFTKHGIYTKEEITARAEIHIENYSTVITIEANTMVYMATNLYLPALSEFSGDLASTVATKAEIGIESPVEKELVRTLTDGIAAIHEAAIDLEANNAAAHASRTRRSSATRTATTSCRRWSTCAPASTRWRRSAAPSTGPCPPTTRCCSGCSRSAASPRFALVPKSPHLRVARTQMRLFWFRGRAYDRISAPKRAYGGILAPGR